MKDGERADSSTARLDDDLSYLSMSYKPEACFWNGLPMIPETWRLISVVILIFSFVDRLHTPYFVHACFVPFPLDTY